MGADLCTDIIPKTSPRGGSPVALGGWGVVVIAPPVQVIKAP